MIYKCSKCDLLCLVLDKDTKPFLPCGCNAGIIAEVSAVTRGNGGIQKR